MNLKRVFQRIMSVNKVTRISKMVQFPAWVLFLLIVCCRQVECFIFKSTDNSASGSRAATTDKILSVGDTLVLKCEAETSVVKWVLPRNQIYEGWSDPKRDGRLQISDTVIENGQNISTLRLQELKYTDTGAYRCNNSKKVTETYVFVPGKDSNKVLLHFTRRRRMQSIYYNRDSFIGCKVTDPDANVQLFINRVHMKQFRQYDPKKGFLIPAHSFEQHQYRNPISAHCEATIDGQTDTARFAIISRKKAQNLTLTIDLSQAKYPYEGGQLSLTVLAKGVSRKYFRNMECQWKYPSQEKEEAQERISVEAGFRLHAGRSEYYANTFSIRQLKLEDSGNYSCKCIFQRSQQSFVSTAIKIASEEGHIKLLKQSEVNMSMHSSPFSRAPMNVSFEAWPPNPNMEWFQYNSALKGELTKKVNATDDGRIIIFPSLYDSENRLDDPPRLTEKHHSWLMINRPTIQESGKYFLRVQAGKKEKNFTFWLTVKENAKAAAKVFIRDDFKAEISKPEARFLNVGETYSIACVSTGHPLAKVSMSWKPCLALEICQEQNITNEARSVNGTFEIALIYTTILNATGTFKCHVTDHLHSLLLENPQPTSTDYVEVIVTDIPNSRLNQGFVLTGNHVRSHTDGDPNTLYEGDALNVTCSFQKYDYPTVSLIMNESMQFDKESLLQRSAPTHVDTDIKITYKSESNFSDAIQLSFTQLKPEYSGNYSCFGVQSGTIPFYRTRQKEIKVVKLVKPTFLNTSEAVKKVHYQKQTQLRCSASGVPQPMVEWHKNGQPFKGSGTRVKISPNGENVTFIATVEEDAGSYDCFARNRAGTVQASIRLRVIGGIGKAEITAAISAGCVLLLLVLVLLIAVGLLKKKERAKTKILQDLYDQLMSTSRQNDTHEQKVQLDPNRPLNKQTENLPYDRRYELDKSWLQFGAMLGEGQFGKVVRGILTLPTSQDDRSFSGDFEDLPVAVKMPQHGRSLQEQKALLDELKIMIHLSHHVNVLGLIGAVTKWMAKGELYVVVELCSKGSLLDHLRKRRSTFVSELVEDETLISESRELGQVSDGYLQPDDKVFVSTPVNTTGRQDLLYQAEINPNWSEDLFKSRYTRNFIATSDLLSYAFQAANGMDFLSIKNFIHRDLACRNLLLTENNVVKIADFGLAKQDQNYHIQKSKNVPLPIKWMALESIVDHNFTSKSDVWAFGVVLWELFALGETPYADQQIDRGFVSLLREGSRLEQTENTPDELYNLMRQCWLLNPQDRPTFAELREKIRNQLMRCSKQQAENLEKIVLDYEQKQQEMYYNIASVVETDTQTSAKSASNALKMQDYCNTSAEQVPLCHLDSSGCPSKPVENSAYMVPNTCTQKVTPIRNNPIYMMQESGYFTSIESSGTDTELSSNSCYHVPKPGNNDLYHVPKSGNNDLYHVPMSYPYTHRENCG